MPTLIARTPNAGSLNHRYLASDTRGLDGGTAAAYLGERDEKTGVGPDYLWAWAETTQHSSGRPARNSVALIGVDTARLAPGRLADIQKALAEILGRLEGVVPADWAAEAAALREVPALAELMPPDWGDLPPVPARVREAGGLEAMPGLRAKGRWRHFLPVAVILGLIVAGSTIWFPHRDCSPEPVPAPNAPVAEDPFANDRNLAALIDGPNRTSTAESILDKLTVRDPRVRPATEGRAVAYICGKLEELGLTPSDMSTWKSDCDRAESISKDYKILIGNRREIGASLKAFRRRYIAALYESPYRDREEIREHRSRNPLTDPDKSEADFRTRCEGVVKPFPELRDEYPALADFMAALDERSRSSQGIKFGEVITVSDGRLLPVSGSWNGVRTVELYVYREPFSKDGEQFTGTVPADGDSSRPARITLAKPPLRPIDKELSKLNFRLCGYYPGEHMQADLRKPDQELSFSIGDAFSPKADAGTWRYAKGKIAVSGTWSSTYPDCPNCRSRKNSLARLEANRDACCSRSHRVWNRYYPLRALSAPPSCQTASS